MAYRTPRSLRAFCREVLPFFQDTVDGDRILGDVEEVVATDRWNRFDRFHDTTKTLVQKYEAAGARAEVFSVPTGGRIGSGRWIIHEAADIRSATADIIRPVRQRLLDYRENPWHVVQWGAATPSKGLEGDLAIADNPEELDAAGNLSGKILLTRMDPRSGLQTFAERGVVGVIFDRPVAENPDAIGWTKFGWGGIPIDRAAIQLVGMVLSQTQGDALRDLYRQHGTLRLRIQADVRRYVGAHDVVCGLVTGREDPQDELWVLAHSAEPGAIDNASGVAACVEIARVIETLAAQGRIPRPRRTIRFLNAYECYGFFGYLERTRRFQTPLAGVCLDTIGARPDVCDGRLSWRSTIPMSAGFVDRVGAAFLRAALRLDNPGYRLAPGPFVSTSDTLIGDPRYGFPCPWLTTHYRKGGKTWAAYHSSADTPGLLSPKGLAACAVGAAGYLAYLADAGSAEAVELARAETGYILQEIEKAGSPEQAAYLRDQHHTSLERLRRWLWGGDRAELLGVFSECERRVREAGPQKKRARKGAGRIPRRTAVLSPTLENTPPGVGERIRASGLSAWALFWADGSRTLGDIADALSVETGKTISPEAVESFFEAHADLGYVELIAPEDQITGDRIAADLGALGLERGMDVVVHSSLSRIGHVIGGPDAVIDAILSVIGKTGTLMMPSFNHRRAQVFNPLTTPTSNGAIPDAFWRRPEAVRTDHPTHALAAIGPRAVDLCRDHVQAGVWTAESPLGRFVHGGGYVLSLGVTHTSSTVYHVAELSVPCGCIDPFGNTDRVVAPDGSVRKVPGLAFRSQVCPVPPEKLNGVLVERGVERSGKVGKADATLVRALDLWQLRREHLKDVCPACPIQPRRA